MPMILYCLPSPKIIPKGRRLGLSKCNASVIKKIFLRLLQKTNTRRHLWLSGGQDLAEKQQNCSINFICTGEVNFELLPKQKVKHFDWRQKSKEKLKKRVTDKKTVSETRP